MSTLASCSRDPNLITCASSAFILSLLQLTQYSTNRLAAVRASEAPVLTWSCVSLEYECTFMSSLLILNYCRVEQEQTEEIQALNLEGHRRSTS